MKFHCSQRHSAHPPPHFSQPTLTHHPTHLTTLPQPTTKTHLNTSQPTPHTTTTSLRPPPHLTTHPHTPQHLPTHPKNLTTNINTFQTHPHLATQPTPTTPPTHNTTNPRTTNPPPLSLSPPSNPPVITVDRLIVIKFPFGLRRLEGSVTRMVMAFVWLVVILLAALPLSSLEYFDNFYGRSGVCLALHITNEKPNGWEYAVFIFLGEWLVRYVVVSVCFGVWSVCGCVYLFSKCDDFFFCFLFLCLPFLCPFLSLSLFNSLLHPFPSSL